MEKEDVLPGGKIDPDPLPLAQRLVCKALRCGPIPEHVAIIMDGNRRFAEKKRVTRAAGHALGYEKVRCFASSSMPTCDHCFTRVCAFQLLSALEWCLELGVEVVSVYAFSIENFKVCSLLRMRLHSSQAIFSVRTVTSSFLSHLRHLSFVFICMHTAFPTANT